MARTHRDVEYHVGDQVFRSYDAAAGHAVTTALANGARIAIDVVVWSRSGARAVFGDDGVERYDEDPDASVFQRIVVTAADQGRVP